MVKTNNKSTKRRKKSTKRQWQLTHAIARLVIRTIKWFIVYIVQKIRQNPLVALGFCLFLYFSFFLAYHVLFNQNMISRSFFFQEEKTNLQKAPSSNLTIKKSLTKNADIENIKEPNVTINSENMLSPTTLQTKTIIDNNASQPSSAPHFFAPVIPQFKTDIISRSQSN